MKREEIIKQARRLPVVEYGAAASSDEAWEVDENDSRFILTKNQLPLLEDRSTFTLSVSGTLRGIDRTIVEFQDVFGDPEEFDVDQNCVLYVTWLAEGVEQRLKQE